MRFRSSPSPTSEDPPLRPRLPGHWCTCRCRDPGQLAALPPCPSRFRAKQSAGKITRLPGATGADRPKPNRTEPNPNRPPTPPPRAGSLSPPTAPKAQPLAPSLPLARGGSFPQREFGGALRLPPRCPSRPFPRGRVRGSAHSMCPSQTEARRGFRGERGHGVLLSAFALWGLFSSSLLKAGVGGRGLAF